MKNNLKKENISREIANQMGFSNLYSKKILDDLINILSKNIKNGNLNLKNFGSFKILKKKDRIGRNPKTKKLFLITARKTIKFIPSKKNNVFFNNF